MIATLEFRVPGDTGALLIATAPRRKGHHPTPSRWSMRDAIHFLDMTSDSIVIAGQTLTSTSRKHREANNLSRSSQHNNEGKESGHKTILDRILNSPRCRKSQNATGWDEELCARYDAIAAQDHSQIATAAKRKQEAKITRERLYEGHGKSNTRIHPKDQVRQRRNQQFTWTEEGSERVDPKESWKWHDHPSKQRHGRNLHHGMSNIFFNGLKVFRLQAMAIFM